MDIFSYADSILQKLKPITYKTLLRAFGIEDLGDFEQRLSNVSGICMIAIDGSDIQAKTGRDDGAFHENMYNIIVCKNTSSHDIDTIFQAVSACKTIAEEIEKKLRQDRRVKTSQLYQLLNSESIKYNGIGPIGDNFYGTMLTFSTSEAFNYQLDTSLWD